MNKLQLSAAGRAAAWALALLIAVATTLLAPGQSKRIDRTARLTPASVTFASSAKSSATHNASIPAMCFAPGTSLKVIDKFEREAYEGNLSNEFRLSNTWTNTATNGSVPTRGTPITLTWSIVPDGTFVPARTSGGTDGANSNMKAYLNGIYGSEASWLPIFQQVFNRWTQLTGVTYVYQATDDGAAMPGYTGTNFSNGASGAIGVRGDVRISGRLIDGPSGVLAYN